MLLLVLVRIQDMFNFNTDRGNKMLVLTFYYSFAILLNIKPT